MPFKKLQSDIQEKLEIQKISTPTPFQSKSIPVIKSGANLYALAPIDSGKTTTLILTTLQKLNFEPKGDSPRAMVLVENKEIALAMYDAFLKFTKNSGLRGYVGYDQLHIDVQKSEIYEGVDILISTPRTLKKLFLLNGVNTSQLQLFSLDNADFLSKSSSYDAFLTVTQSITKCQYVFYSEKTHSVLKRFKSSFMEHSKTISI